MKDNEFPIRKRLRLEHYDYSSAGAYFVTVCTANREKIFWNTVGANCVRPREQLSRIGKMVEHEIQILDSVYELVSVDQYCIMPDHIHMIIHISANPDGRSQNAPTLSRIMKQFKGSISKQVGRPIWQKSFYEHGIRNQQDYNEIWEYIENNPLKYLQQKAP